MEETVLDPYKPEKETSSYTGMAGITVNTILILSAVVALLGLALLLYAFFLPSGILTGDVCTAIGVVLLIAGVLVFGGVELFKRFIRGGSTMAAGLILTRTFPAALSLSCSNISGTRLSLLSSSCSRGGSIWY